MLKDLTIRDLAKPVSQKQIEEKGLLQSIVDHCLSELFIKEFIFSENVFYPEKGITREFSDFVLLVEGIMVVCELKERGDGATVSDELWLQNEIKKATTQHNNSKEFIQHYGNIPLQNHRGHKINIVENEIITVHRIIVYLPSEESGEEVRYKYRHHISNRVGFVHLFHVVDFIGLCISLLTPYELVRYLQFRERMLHLWPDKFEVEPIDERILISQFIFYEARGGYESKDLVPPSGDFSHFFPPTSDIAIIQNLKTLFESIGTSSESLGNNELYTGYYSLLESYAKLHRTELIDMHYALLAAQTKYNDPLFMEQGGFYPYYFYNIRGRTAFLLLAISAPTKDQYLLAFRLITRAYKYLFEKEKIPVEKLSCLVLPDQGNKYPGISCVLSESIGDDAEVEEFIQSTNISLQFGVKKYYE